MGYYLSPRGLDRHPIRVRFTEGVAGVHRRKFTISCLSDWGGVCSLCFEDCGMARLKHINWISNQRARLAVSEFVFWFRNAIIVDHGEPECFGSNFCFWR